MAKPIRKTLHDLLDALSFFPAGDGCAAGAGIIGNRRRKPLVLRGAPQRRFPQPRVTHGKDALVIDLRQRLSVIQQAAGCPSPHAELAPVRAVSPPVIHGGQAGTEIIVIRSHVLIAERSQSETVVNDFFNGSVFSNGISFKREENAQRQFLSASRDDSVNREGKLPSRSGKCQLQLSVLCFARPGALLAKSSRGFNLARGLRREAVFFFGQRRNYLPASLLPICYRRSKNRRQVSLFEGLEHLLLHFNHSSPFLFENAAGQIFCF